MNYGQSMGDESKISFISTIPLADSEQATAGGESWDVGVVVCSQDGTFIKEWTQNVRRGDATCDDFASVLLGTCPYVFSGSEVWPLLDLPLAYELWCRMPMVRDEAEPTLKDALAELSITVPSATAIERAHATRKIALKLGEYLPALFVLTEECVRRALRYADSDTQWLEDLFGTVKSEFDFSERPALPRGSAYSYVSRLQKREWHTSTAAREAGITVAEAKRINEAIVAKLRIAAAAQAPYNDERGQRLRDLAETLGADWEEPAGDFIEIAPRSTVSVIGLTEMGRHFWEHQLQRRGLSYVSLGDNPDYVLGATGLSEESFGRSLGKQLPVLYFDGACPVFRKRAMEPFIEFPWATYHDARSGIAYSPEEISANGLAAQWVARNPFSPMTAIADGVDELRSVNPVVHVPPRLAPLFEAWKRESENPLELSAFSLLSIASIGEFEQLQAVAAVVLAYIDALNKPSEGPLGTADGEVFLGAILVLGTDIDALPAEITSLGKQLGLLSDRDPREAFFEVLAEEIFSAIQTDSFVASAITEILTEMDKGGSDDAIPWAEATGYSAAVVNQILKRFEVLVKEIEPARRVLDLFESEISELLAEGALSIKAFLARSERFGCSYATLFRAASGKLEKLNSIFLAKKGFTTYFEQCIVEACFERETKKGEQSVFAEVDTVFSKISADYRDLWVYLLNQKRFVHFQEKILHPWLDTDQQIVAILQIAQRPLTVKALAKALYCEVSDFGRPEEVRYLAEGLWWVPKTADETELDALIAWIGGHFEGSFGRQSHSISLSSLLAEAEEVGLAEETLLKAMAEGGFVVDGDEITVKDSVDEDDGYDDY